MDKGTLYQLKNTINRTAVPTDPSDNMKAAEDFLLVVLHAHITAASEAILKRQRIESVSQLADSVAASFITLEKGSTVGKSSDGVLVYACDLLTLGLLWMGFHDAIREGDGERVMMYWKFLLIVFKVTGRKNYSIEALNIQFQKQCLSKRQCAQLVWSRFINTHGQQGRNIPCDLHLEHLNRRIKTALRNLGSNITTSAIAHAAKSVGVAQQVCEVFENETRHNTESSSHPNPKFDKDYALLLSVLQEAEVFSVHSGRSHSSFHLTQGVMESFDKTKFLDWAKTRLRLIK